MSTHTWVLIQIVGLYIFAYYCYKKIKSEINIYIKDEDVISVISNFILIILILIVFVLHITDFIALFGILFGSIKFISWTLKENNS